MDQLRVQPLRDLAGEPVVAQVDAVVGGEQDHRVLVEAQVVQLLEERGTQPGCLERAENLSLSIDSGLEVEQEDVLEGDDLTFHPDDFRDVCDPTRSVLHAFLMDDHVDRGGDLLADRLHRQLHPRHHRHRLES